MIKMKLSRNVSRELAGIRRLAEALPPGKYRRLSNKCDKIQLVCIRAQARLDAPVGVLFREGAV